MFKNNLKICKYDKKIIKNCKKMFKTHEKMINHYKKKLKIAKPENSGICSRIFLADLQHALTRHLLT